MQEIYDRSLAATSFVFVMLALADGMALLLGLIGIYAVISYAVSQRTRDHRNPPGARGAAAARVG